MERGKEVPIHFVLGFHGDVDITHNLGGLDTLREKILFPLENSPKGKVLVLMELSNHTKAEAEELSILVNHGVLPSQAMLSSWDCHIKPRVSEEQYQVMKQATFADEFHKKLRSILDEAYWKYPGRVDILAEWAPADQVNPNGFSQGRDLIVNFFRFKTERQSSESYLAFKNLVNGMGNLARIREERYMQTLEERLAIDPDIIAACGFWGLCHTGLYIGLKRKGYNVSRTITDNPFGDPGEPIFNGLEAAQRYIRFFPNRFITEDIWKSTYERLFGAQLENL